MQSVECLVSGSVRVGTLPATVNDKAQVLTSLTGAWRQCACASGEFTDRFAMQSALVAKCLSILAAAIGRRVFSSLYTDLCRLSRYKRRLGSIFFTITATIRIQYVRSSVLSSGTALKSKKNLEDNKIQTTVHTENQSTA